MNRLKGALVPSTAGQRSCRLVVLLCVILAACPWPGSVAPLHAEEKGVVIHLNYVRAYSNWGPTNAYGSAQFWPVEGVVVLAVHKLPRLLNGNTYVAWIVNTTTGEALRLDSFNTSEAGEGTLDVIFDTDLPRAADAMVVTLMHPGDPTSLPGPRRALVGYFPALSPAPAPRPAHHAGVHATPRPTVVELPRTGGGGNQDGASVAQRRKPKPRHHP